MNTADLQGAALDWAVAQAEGLLAFGYRTDGRRFAVEDSDGQIEGFMPSRDWAQGGPIIEREKISTAQEFASGRIEWAAWTPALIRDDAEAFGYGPTPLIAAMRCYVASRLGDEVDVPEEVEA